MKPTIDARYTTLINQIYYNGTLLGGRNGYIRALMDTFPQLRWNLNTESFPIIALRKQNIDHYINEFLWELNGGSNINDLNNVYAPVDSRFLWKSWANSKGHIAYSYGECWRYNSATGYGAVDQLDFILKELKSNPVSRRLTLVTQDVIKNHRVDIDYYEVPQVPPCHPCIQFSSDGVFLNAHVFSRSQDIVVGLPGDMIRYSLLTMVLAKLSGLVAKNICFSFTNIHYYMEHEAELLDLIKKSLPINNGPIMTIADTNQITFDDFKYEDFALIDYNPNAFKSFKLIV